MRSRCPVGDLVVATTLGSVEADRRVRRHGPHDVVGQQAHVLVGVAGVGELREPSEDVADLELGRRPFSGGCT